MRAGKRTIKSKEKDSRRRGLKEGWIRISFVLREENLDKVRALAWWERKTPRKVMDEALTQYLKGKKIKPIPSQDDGGEDIT